MKVVKPLQYIRYINVSDTLKNRIDRRIRGEIRCLPKVGSILASTGQQAQKEPTERGKRLIAGSRKRAR